MTKKFILCLALLFSIKATADDHLFKGKHYIASYYECDHDALVNVDQLKASFLNAVELSGATILEHVDYVFPGDGMTLVVLLAESHAIIHTYPEYDACFVDLFTCGEDCYSPPFEEVLISYLKPKHANAEVIKRS